MVICEIVAGEKRTPLTGNYLMPSTLEHFLDLEEALTQLWYQDAIVIGDLNTATGKSQNLRSQQVADLLMEFWLVGLLHHFRQPPHEELVAGATNKIVESKV